MHFSILTDNWEQATNVSKELCSELSEGFADNSGQPFEFEGALVHKALLLPVHKGNLISVRFIGANSSERQAVRLDVSRGVLATKGGSGRSVVLWEDSSPASTEFEVQKIRGFAELTVWNAWEGPHGSVSAWLRNAGMRLTALSDSSWRLECSDGPGLARFDNLVLEVSVE